MTSPARWLPPAIVTLAIGCATMNGDPSGDRVALQTPQTVDGDPQALAWPFHVDTEAGLRAFRLRLDAGGTLVAIRPDTANPEPSAPGWTGSHQDSEAIWSGPPSSARTIPLTIMVRAMSPGDQELQVRYAPESARGVSGWTCERWIYRISEERVERDGC
ncbi:MAG: hypothetical protein ACREMK_04755 [Gemmatimonadota bacterium]